jgi:hypothetical protein
MASGDLDRQIAMMRAQGLQPFPVMFQQPQILQPQMNHEPLQDDIEARFIANDKDHQALLAIIDQLVSKMADLTERLEIAEDKIAAFEMGVRDSTRAA